MKTARHFWETYSLYRSAGHRRMYAARIAYGIAVLGLSF